MCSWNTSALLRWRTPSGASAARWSCPAGWRWLWLMAGLVSSSSSSSLADPVYALLQRVRRGVHGPLRHRHQPHHVRQVLDRPLKPARAWEPALAVRLLGEDAVRQPGRPERRRADRTARRTSSGYRSAITASITRPLDATSSPRRSLASASTLAAGSNSASSTTGAAPGVMTSTSGCSPAWPANACVFSECTRLRDSIPWSRPPSALLALGSVCCGIPYPRIDDLRYYTTQRTPVRGKARPLSAISAPLSVIPALISVIPGP